MLETELLGRDRMPVAACASPASFADRNMVFSSRRVTPSRRCTGRTTDQILRRRGDYHSKLSACGVLFGSATCAK